MLGEIWTYKAIKTSDNSEKTRPVLIIGSDGENGLQFVDINYVLISSSAKCGIYDIALDEETAHSIGLKKSSVIKTTKIYTGSMSKLGNKIGTLPEDIKEEFKRKYQQYQDLILSKW